MKPLQIHTIVSMPFEENTYILWLPDRTEAVVIDPGLEPDLILDFLRRSRTYGLSHLSTRMATPITSPATRP